MAQLLTYTTFFISGCLFLAFLVNHIRPVVIDFAKHDSIQPLSQQQSVSCTASFRLAHDHIDITIPDDRDGRNEIL